MKKEIKSLFADRTILLYNIVFLAVIMIYDVLYIVFPDIFAFKIMASALFFACGLFNYLLLRNEHGLDSKSNRFAICMVVGLAFAFAGDVAINLIFALGAGLFAIGHIWFFIAYLQLSKINWRDAIIFAIVFGISLCVILLYPNFDFKGMFPVIIGYALIISAMLSKSISNIFDKKLTPFVKYYIFVGSMLFFLSDMCLLFRNFGGMSRLFSVFCLGLYYPAEIILATSIYYGVKSMIIAPQHQQSASIIEGE